MSRDLKSTISELLSKDKSLTMHCDNPKKLVAEVLKEYFGVAPVIMSNVSKIVHSSYNLRNERKFRSKNIHATIYGAERVFQPYRTKNIKPSAKGI